MDLDDLKIRCRACMDKTDVMNDLFAIIYENKSIADILAENGVWVESDSSDSALFCKNCSSIVLNFYQFKIIFKENQRYLRKLVQLNQNECGTFEADITVENEGCKFENISLINEGDQNLLVVDNGDDATDGDVESIEVVIKIGSDENNSNKKGDKSAPKTACDTCNNQNYSGESHDCLCKRYLCEICGKGFQRKCYLRDHKETHNSEKKYVCLVCNKRFKSRVIYSRHKSRHENVRKFVCEICGVRFNEMGTLKMHVQLKHVRDRKFMCYICGLKFPLKSTLDKHIKRHNKSREKTFKCGECDNFYSDKSSLTRHMTIKHSENKVSYTCDFCPKMYTTKTNLLKHIRKKHSNREYDSTLLDSVT